MSEEIDTNYLSNLDRRITDHDTKFNFVERDFSEVKHEIKEVLNRINGGLSPSVQAVLKENGEVKLTLTELSHKIDVTTMEMKATVRETAELTRSMLSNFEEAKIQPMERDVKSVKQEMGDIKKTLIYGLVGAVIVAIGAKTITYVWDTFINPPAASVAQAK